MKGSDKNTRDGRVRVTYVDDAEIIAKIEELAFYTYKMSFRKRKFDIGCGLATY